MPDYFGDGVGVVAGVVAAVTGFVDGAVVGAVVAGNVLGEVVAAGIVVAPFDGAVVGSEGCDVGCVDGSETSNPDSVFSSANGRRSRAMLMRRAVAYETYTGEMPGICITVS